MPWLHGPHSLTARGRVPRSVWDAAREFRPDAVFTIAGSWDYSALVAQQVARRLRIPLIASLKGLRDYEAQVQTEIATLRGQSMGTNQVSALVPGLKAIIEKYPELKANESFNALMKNLTETEDRIALARNYSNDITTFYNTRLERIPDRFVAQIVAMQPASLFVAQGFEHKVPDVKI
jgi:hypothetical protein